MKIMWLLLLISFGMTSCLLITLAIFGVTHSKERDGKGKPVEAAIMTEPTLPARQNTSTQGTKEKLSEAQTQSEDSLVSTSRTK